MGPRRGQGRQKRFTLPQGLHYSRGFVSPQESLQTLEWLNTVHPIWEQRFSTRRPPPAGEKQRWLLRPVYWLGNWQFACLDYYHPPKGVLHRCVRAEPYPPVLQRIVARIEDRARAIYRGKDLPDAWRLNTCLINYYGTRIDAENNRRIDAARVGEHRDYEPGPVASISFGERAFFQFVESKRRGTREGVVFQQWLDDSALQIFGGPLWKERYFHRVQRVENKLKRAFPIAVQGFEARRINFTFRYVPEEHIVSFQQLPLEKRLDIEGYLQQLARHSSFFRQQLNPISAYF